MEGKRKRDTIDQSEIIASESIEVSQSEPVTRRTRRRAKDNEACDINSLDKNTNSDNEASGEQQQIDEMWEDIPDQLFEDEGLYYDHSAVEMIGLNENSFSKEIGELDSEEANEVLEEIEGSLYEPNLYYKGILADSEKRVLPLRHRKRVSFYGIDKLRYICFFSHYIHIPILFIHLYLLIHIFVLFIN
jgi:hypothetical protein